MSEAGLGLPDKAWKSKAKTECVRPKPAESLEEKIKP